jgi:hypothetical protein
MTTNPILEEIWKTRADLLHECGDDWDIFFAGVLERQLGTPPERLVTDVSEWQRRYKAVDTSIRDQQDLAGLWGDETEGIPDDSGHNELLEELWAVREKTARMSLEPLAAHEPPSPPYDAGTRETH